MLDAICRLMYRNFSRFFGVLHPNLASLLYGLAATKLAADRRPTCCNRYCVRKAQTCFARVDRSF